MPLTPATDDVEATSTLPMVKPTSLTSSRLPAEAALPTLVVAPVVSTDTVTPGLLANVHSQNPPSGAYSPVVSTVSTALTTSSPTWPR